jgi:hypothetical protein
MATTPRLQDLRTRLLHLHKLLLDDARRDWEATYGPVSSHELLQLAMQHERFAWLRALSGMISSIDAAVDEAEGALPATEAEVFVRQVEALLGVTGQGAFETKYRDALQRSPEVVMAHAAVIQLIRASSGRRPGA